MEKKMKFTRFIGDDKFYVLDGQTGRKIRAEDAVLITDKYSTQNGLVVHKDEVDVVNPQSFIKAKKESPIRNAKLLRPESENRFGFISSVSEIEDGDSSDPAGRTSSKAQNLYIFEVTSELITFKWLPPEDSGSSAISGWLIERETPVGGGFSTLNSNTGSGALTYTDSTVASGTQYNYRVSPINRDGTGTVSDEISATTD